MLKGWRRITPSLKDSDLPSTIALQFSYQMKGYDTHVENIAHGFHRLWVKKIRHIRIVKIQHPQKRGRPIIRDRFQKLFVMDPVNDPKMQRLGDNQYRIKRFASDATGFYYGR